MQISEVLYYTEFHGGYTELHRENILQPLGCDSSRGVIYVKLMMPANRIGWENVKCFEVGRPMREKILQRSTSVAPLLLGEAG